MAARSRSITTTSSRGQPIRVTIPSGLARRAGAGARRAGSAAARAAMSERHTIVAVGAAGVLGLMARQGVQLPHISALGIPATYGLAAWGLSKVSKSRMMEHAATGLLSIGVFQLAAGMTPGGLAAPPGAGGSVQTPDEGDIEETES